MNRQEPLQSDPTPQIHLPLESYFWRDIAFEALVHLQNSKILQAPPHHLFERSLATCLAGPKPQLINFLTP
jgi:hypothetical protein